MRKTNSLLPGRLLVLFATLASGCASGRTSTDPMPRAAELRTENRSNQAARTVLTAPQEHRLAFPAFLLGVEKGSAKRLAAPSPHRGLDTTASPAGAVRPGMLDFLGRSFSLADPTSW